MHTYIHTLHTYIHYIHYIHTYMHAYITYINTDTQTYIHNRRSKHTNIQTYKHTYMHTLHTCMHAWIHAHMQATHSFPTDMNAYINTSQYMA